jgi:outer membrane putative beta-barrel porin/alpha-amylase
VLDGPESLVRFGVAKRAELRLMVPDYFYNLNTGDRSGSRFGDFAVGVKEQLGPTPGGFDVSVILFLSFPTGANTVSSGGYDPGVQVPWSRALSANWTAAGMLSMYWPAQGHTRNVTGEFTFLLDRQLTKPWDAFVEYAGDLGSFGRQLATADHVVQHRLWSAMGECLARTGPRRGSEYHLRSWSTALRI